jgi:tetratricopeptide (TPR) repeat protein
MSRDDWFRNRNWNDEIAAQFEAKLKRARRKGQYLRIQACTLARSEPGVALELLERYFAQEDDRCDDAQAHVDRATALLSLGRVNEALDSYEDALRTEAKVPNMLTQAYIELPYAVSVRGVRSRYDRALEILQNHRKRLMFPVDYFKWNAAQAIIAGSTGNRDTAKEFASAALGFAAKDHSGFRYHPGIGLVSDDHAEALRQLRGYCDS